MKKKLTKKQIKKLEKKERNKKDKEWRERVLFRDKYKCIICQEFERKKINVHHIIPREIKEFRWDINNGIVLCQKHHKWSLECSPHRNPFVFYYWMLENRKNQLFNLEQKYNNLFKPKSSYS